MLKKILAGLLYAIPAVLVVVPDSMYFPFISGKGLLFRFAVEIAVAIYIYLAIFNPSLRPKKTLVLLSVGLFTLIVLLADIFGVSPLRSFWSNFERSEGFVLIGHLCAYVIVVGSVLKTSKQWANFWYGTLSVSIAMCLFALLQVSGGAAINQGTIRLDALMGNSAYFAGLLLFQIFILLFLLRRDGVRSPKIFYSFAAGSVLFALVYIAAEQATAQGRIIAGLSVLVSVLLVILARNLREEKLKLVAAVVFGVLLLMHGWLLLLTQTRGAILGVIGGLLIAGLITAFSEKNKGWKIAAYGTIAIIVLGIGGFIAFKDSNLIRSNQVLSRFADISWSETKTQARQIIWPMALKAAGERPILGWGQEGFNHAFLKFYDPELWRHEPWFDRTHNVYLDWLVAAGILGFAAYIFMYVGAFIALKKTLFKDNRSEFAILTGLLAAYAFQNLFIFDNLGSYILFFSFLAFLHATLVSQQPDEGEHLKRPSDLSPALIAGLCALGFVVVAYFLVGRPYVQNTSLIKALSPQPSIYDNKEYFKKAFAYNGMGASEAREQYMTVLTQVVQAPNLDQKIKEEFFNEALAQVDIELQKKAVDAKALLTIANGFNQSGSPDHAITILEKLRLLSPKKQHILMQLGIAHLLKKDDGAAYAVLKENYEISPEFVDGAMLYVVATLEEGNVEEAFLILANFAKQGVAPRPYVVQILKNKNYRKELVVLLQTAYNQNPEPATKMMLDEVLSGK